MKYIRTKDGKIIDTQPKTNGVFDGSQFFILNENELLERYPEEYGQMGMWCCRYLYRFVGIVEKQADIIEELCDEFVIYAPAQNFIWSIRHNFINLNSFQNFKEELLNIWKTQKGKATGYGCIVTDKGLIYVAKMNEKGVLELL